MDVITSHGFLGNAARAFIARRHKLLIDGQWVDAKSGETFAVFDPSNGQQIATVAEGGAADIDAAVAAARYKQSGWGREMGYEAIEMYTETKAVAALL